MREEMRNPVHWAILILAVIGLLFAVYQTYEHYFLTTAVCDFTESFSCSAVTESSYGEFPPDSGMSTALWGVFWWLGLLLLTRRAMRAAKEAKTHALLFLYALAGFAFALYLIAVELVILPKITGQIIICPFCTVQHVFIVMILAASFFELGRPTEQIKGLFFTGTGRKRRLDPRPFFVIGALALLVLGQFLILGAGEPLLEYPEFAACLADERATMYGFDACPNCNKQKTLIGVESFKEHIDKTGLYVRCRPKEEGQRPLGGRSQIISSVAPILASTTANEACAINVGEGTPTWVIHGKKYVGSQTIEDLALASGCPLPPAYEKQAAGGYTLIG